MQPHIWDLPEDIFVLLSLLHTLLLYLFFVSLFMERSRMVGTFFALVALAASGHITPLYVGIAKGGRWTKADQKSKEKIKTFKRFLRSA